MKYCVIYRHLPTSKYGEMILFLKKYMAGTGNGKKMQREEMRKRKRTGDPFVKIVMQEPRIMIIGTCDD